MTTYYERNREARLAYQRDYRQRNRERKIDQSMEWDALNPDKAPARWRRYREKHPNVGKAWLANNKERRNAQKREYDRHNRAAIRFARKLGVSIPEARRVLNAITAKKIIIQARTHVLALSRGATMRAILIDPRIQMISSINLERSGGTMVESMHAVIGCDGLDHTTIDDEHDSIWVDDEGLKRGQPIWAFKLPIISDPFAGKALVIGADDAGRTKPPFISVEFLRQEIEWLGLIVPQVDWIDEPNGVRAVVTYSRPKAS